MIVKFFVGSFQSAVDVAVLCFTITLTAGMINGTLYVIHVVEKSGVYYEKNYRSSKSKRI